MKTLILCPIGLGNFIMATPAIRLLSLELGKDDLGILALKRGIRHMASNSNYFGEIFEWDPDREGLKAGLRALKAIRAGQYEAILLFFPTCDWRYFLFATLTGIPRKLGFRYRDLIVPRVVQTDSIPVDPRAHDVDQNLRLVRYHLEN